MNQISQSSMNKFLNYQQMNSNNLVNVNNQLYSNNNLNLNPNLINHNGLNLNSGYLNLNPNTYNQLNTMNNSINNMSTNNQSRSSIISNSAISQNKDKKPILEDNNNDHNVIIKLSQIIEKCIWYNVHKKKKPKKEEKDYKDNIEDSEIYFNGDSPSKRWGHSCCVYKNKMIIFGGRYNYRSLNSMYIFDLETLTWSKIETRGLNSGNIPIARDSHTALVYKNYMYVFGGNWQNKKLNDFWQLNLDDYT